MSIPSWFAQEKTLNDPLFHRAIEVDGVKVIIWHCPVMSNQPNQTSDQFSYTVILPIAKMKVEYGKFTGNDHNESGLIKHARALIFHDLKRVEKVIR